MYAISSKNIISKSIYLEISSFLEEQVFIGLFSEDDAVQMSDYIGYWLDLLIDSGKITRHHVSVYFELSSYEISVKFRQRNCLMDSTISVEVEL